MRAGGIRARRKRAGGGRDPPHRVDGRRSGAHLGRVVLRPGNQEVVEHQLTVVAEHASIEIAALGVRIVGQRDVRIAPIEDVERPAAAHGDRLHADAGFLLEFGQDGGEQSRVVDAGCGRHVNHAGLTRAGERERQREREREPDEHRPERPAHDRTTGRRASGCGIRPSRASGGLPTKIRLQVASPRLISSRSTEYMRKRMASMWNAATARRRASADATSSARIGLRRERLQDRQEFVQFGQGRGRLL